jgi:hypothetical protein
VEGTCHKPTAGSCEGFSYYWNYSADGLADWRVQDNLAFVRKGSNAVDGLFTDEIEMFPGDGGQTIADISTLATMMSRDSSRQAKWPTSE